jgi:predicted Mrr-cat superfamily restriction endonuclease
VTFTEDEASTAARCWLVRAGRGGEHIEAFVRRGVVTLGWARIPGLGDLREHDDDAILALLTAARRGQPRADLRELVAFRDEIALGDVVVTVDPRVRDLVFGEVAGPYEYARAPLVGDHRHVRTVRWFGRCGRDEVAERLSRSVRHYQRTVLLLPDQSEWLGLADRIAQGDGRDPGDG